MRPTRSPAWTIREAPAQRSARRLRDDVAHHESLLGERWRRGGREARRCPPRGGHRHCDVPDHRADELVLGQRRGRRRQDELAVAEHDDVVADLEDLLEMVRDVEDRDAAGDERAYALEQPAHAVAFERRGRLVEQQDARTSRERAGDLDDLALLDGERGALHVGVDVEVPLAQDSARLGAHRAPVDDTAAARLAAEEDVLGDRELGDDHRVLEDGGDAASPGADVANGGAGSPSKRTSPASGASSPQRIETSVDLPAPLRPTRPRQRPGWSAVSTLRSACVLPKRLLTPIASTTG